MRDPLEHPKWMPELDMPATGYVVDYLAHWAVFLLLAGAALLFLYRVWFRAGRRTLGARLLGALLVGLATLGGAGVVGETYLRYVYDATDSYGLMVTNYAWFHRHWQPNELGYRDDEFTPQKSAHVTRVACVGDSFTAGYGVSDPADLFPQRLSAVLGAQHDVLNLGIIGIDTGDEGDLIQTLVGAWNVDHVVLAYCLNDLGDLLPADSGVQRMDIVRDSWIDPWSSYLLDWLWYRSYSLRNPEVSGYFEWVARAYEDEAIWGQQTARFRRIAALCRDRRVRLDVVVFPMFGSWGEEYPFHRAHERVVATWEGLGVNVVDLRETYSGMPAEDLTAGRYDAHPNEAAHQLAAKAIWRGVFGGR